MEAEPKGPQRRGVPRGPSGSSGTGSPSHAGPYGDHRDLRALRGRLALGVNCCLQKARSLPSEALGSVWLWQGQLPWASTSSVVFMAAGYL